jgi:hypothetical protein
MAPTICDSLPDDPTITLLFTGLLGFRIDDASQYCRIGIHNEQHHDLRILICKSSPEPVPSREIVLDFSSRRMSRDLWVDVFDSMGIQKKGICLYEKQPWTRLPPPGTPNPSDERDFRWLVDVKGEGFLLGPYIDLFDNVYTPSIYVSFGTFYTHKRTDPANVLQKAPVTGNVGNGFRRATGPPVLPFGPAASFVGANMYLDPGDSVTLKLGGPSGGVYQLLQTTIRDDTTYQVLIEGGPADKHQSVREVGVLIPLSDFLFCYSAFDIDINALKYDLQHGGSASDIIPCIPSQIKSGS